MNNASKIVLINENGVKKEYGAIPDLWHLAEQLRTDRRTVQAEAVLQVWHMAHDLKAVIEKQGEARIVSADNFSDAKPTTLSRIKNTIEAIEQDYGDCLVDLSNDGLIYGISDTRAHWLGVFLIDGEEKAGMLHLEFDGDRVTELYLNID